MATEPMIDEEDDRVNLQSKTALDLPRIPINQVYDWCIDTKHLEYQTGYSLWSRVKEFWGIFPRYVLKDFEQTITLKASTENVRIKLLEGLVKEQKRSLHLGLVQVGIKPLLPNNGFLGVPIKVCLRDTRFIDFQESTLALVETNLSQGPFYFNCFPDISFYLKDTEQSLDALILHVVTGGIDLVLSYRVVCEVMEHPKCKLSSRTSGETTYHQSITGTQNLTKWNQVHIPDSWFVGPEG